MQIMWEKGWDTVRFETTMQKGSEKIQLADLELQVAYRKKLRFYAKKIVLRSFLGQMARFPSETPDQAECNTRNSDS